jgi:hypothetical protein
VRLLLDEHYSKVIAEQLRERDNDVVSAAERSDLAGLKDPELFQLMQSERRGIVTENWADFQHELRKAEEQGTTHYGLLFTSRNRIPRGRNTIGLFVRVLADFLQRYPAEDALLNSYRWLPDTEL